MGGMHLFKRIAGVCSLLIAAQLAAAESAEMSHDGLVRVESKKVDALYTLPGASLAAYKRVVILDCYVAFRKNWQRDQNSSAKRVTSEDMAKIKQQLADEFRKVYTAELTKGGYEVVNSAGEDVLILRPAIIDLDVTAPDIPIAGRSRTFATSAGGMTLLIELLDGASGQILARAVDREVARDDGLMSWQNSVTNRAEADRILHKWANLARIALDNARAAPTPQEKAP